MKYPDARLLIFSKAPDPGQVKTRLIPLLGAVGAADFYENMLHSTLEMAVNSDLCPVDVWCSPAVTHPFFQQCKNKYGVQLYQQTKGDIGCRMAHALARAGAPGRPQVLIGADCPSLSASHLDEAFDLLSNGSKIILGPAKDGGYYLVGMHGLYPFVFSDIPWSTPAVLDKTIECIKARQLEYHCLATHRDIDTPDDYHALLEYDSRLTKQV